MKKFIIVGLVCLAVISQSLSIALAAEPPKQMMNEVIHTYVGNLTSYGEIGELVDCVKEMGNKVSWEKVNNGWIMNTKNTDVMTKKSNEGSWMFVHDSSVDNVTRLYFTRLVLNGLEMKRPGSILMTPEFLGCWKKANTERPRIEEEQRKAAEAAELAEQKAMEAQVLVAEKEKQQLAQSVTDDLKRMELERRQGHGEFLKKLTGSYQKSKNQKSLIETLNVTVNDDQTMFFSMISKEPQETCAVPSSTAKLDYEGYGDPKATFSTKEPSCKIELRFSKRYDSPGSFKADVRAVGCSQFCDTPKGLFGVFNQVTP